MNRDAPEPGRRRLASAPPRPPAKPSAATGSGTAARSACPPAGGAPRDLLDGTLPGATVPLGRTLPGCLLVRGCRCCQSPSRIARSSLFKDETRGPVRLLSDFRQIAVRVPFTLTAMPEKQLEAR